MSRFIHVAMSPVGCRFMSVIVSVPLTDTVKSTFSMSPFSRYSENVTGVALISFILLSNTNNENVC